ncbi:HupE/UreJ family protein [Colwellia demingiae]|uniref:HupE/UreJ family protein n=1 Tax=Colwellia demingiae TaxID=89401 RepID=A0A5C6QA16_9GAMM|nr:HupE/UreJ family protein [Colwellia demingiae]TWX65884.1 HupE/UreJ family protein [Colwellia demingiae]
MKYLISLCLFMLISQSVFADDMRPASLTINSLDNKTFDVVWKLPLKSGKTPPLSVTFDEQTMIVGTTRSRKTTTAVIEKWSIERAQGLTGFTVYVDGLTKTNKNVLLRIIDKKQQTITTVLNADQQSFSVSGKDDLKAENTILTYIVLGTEHILIGFDHLLFVACLVYISGTRKKLLMTITGFTVAHSITLILAATGVLSIPIPPVEAVIALSIVFLAWEIAKNNKDSLSLSYPVLVSSSFGLLHGFGFASVLADIGLPETEKIMALLCFNIGVEIGQLLFVAALFIIFYVISKLYKPLTKDTLRFPVSYLCGSLASIWMLERLAAF